MSFCAIVMSTWLGLNYGSRFPSQIMSEVFVQFNSAQSHVDKKPGRKEAVVAWSQNTWGVKDTGQNPLEVFSLTL